MKLDLESIGLTSEELQNRVVQALANNLLTTVRFSSDPDDDDAGYEDNSMLKHKLDTEVMNRIDQAITELGDKHVLPLVTSIVEGHVLQKTNTWGEKTGERLTFTEYLVKQAELYLAEKVDYNGNTRAQDTYNWKERSTRIAYMIDNHLHFSIETALTKALKDMNNSVAVGLTEAIKISLKATLDGIKVNTTVKT